MALTLTEKDHFTNQLRELVRKRIQQEKAEDPSFEVALHREAVAWVKDAMGITDLLEELADLERKKEAIETSLAEKRTEIVAAASGHLPEDLPTHRHRNYSGLMEFDSYPDDVAEALKRMRDTKLAELKAQHPVGKMVVALEDFETEMAGQIMLACSHREMQETWKVVKERLPQVEVPTERRHRRIVTEREHS